MLGRKPIQKEEIPVWDWEKLSIKSSCEGYSNFYVQFLFKLPSIK